MWLTRSYFKNPSEAHAIILKLWMGKKLVTCVSKGIDTWKISVSNHLIRADFPSLFVHSKFGSFLVWLLHDTVLHLSIHSFIFIHSVHLKLFSVGNVIQSDAHKIIKRNRS